MASEDKNGTSFQLRGCVQSPMDHPKVAAMDMSSGSMGHFYGSGWDPIVSLGQAESYLVGVENQGMLHYQPDSGLGEMMPKLPSFGSGSFCEMVNPFVGLPECGQIMQGVNENSQENCGVSGDGVSSGGGRDKRRASHSPFKPNKRGGDQENDNSGDSLETMKEQNEKKQRTEQGLNPDLSVKRNGKQVKDNPDSGGAPKENYIHVRAKRGQATNSHSLAERVRRERISERMKLLQELVPGCNKITGKAVMLDEIINYVQSLQQQVEFLSMKLATVSPELNIDIERILSTDILRSQSNIPNPALLGFAPGFSSSHPFPQGGLPGIQSSGFHPMHPQSVWDNELHNLLQMGFDTNPSTSNLEAHGRRKMDL